jgi:outer membrane immunogenic protein
MSHAIAILQYPSPAGKKMITEKSIKGLSMKKIAILSVALGALLATSPTALSADVDIASTYDWTGLYLGIHGGYGFGKFDDETFGPNNANVDGFAGGLLAGYNYQVNSLVLGLEADATLSDINGDNLPAGFIEDFDVDSMFSVRGRFGFAIDTIMPYITGGVAIADADAQHTGDIGDVSKTHFGWTIGAGIEWAATDHIRVRGEFLHSDFGNKTYSFFGGTDPHSLDLDNVNVVRAALIWNF